MFIRYSVPALLAMTIAMPAQAGSFNMDNTKYYIGIEGNQNALENDTGGFITLAPAPVGGSDTARNFDVGLNVGAENGPYGLGLAYHSYNAGFVTEGVPGFPVSSKEHSQVLMLSGTYKFYQQPKWDLYAGPGIGVARTRTTVSDTVFEGEERETNFAWQFEAGTHYNFSSDLRLNAGVRYVDLGHSDTPIDIIGGPPTGNFTSDLTSQEFFIGVQHAF